MILILLWKIFLQSLRRFAKVKVLFSYTAYIFWNTSNKIFALQTWTKKVKKIKKETAPFFPLFFNHAFLRILVLLNQIQAPSSQVNLVQNSCLGLPLFIFILKFRIQYCDFFIKFLSYSILYSNFFKYFFLERHSFKIFNLNILKCKNEKEY